MSSVVEALSAAMGSPGLTPLTNAQQRPAMRDVWPTPNVSSGAAPSSASPSSLQGGWWKTKTRCSPFDPSKKPFRNVLFSARRKHEFALTASTPSWAKQLTIFWTIHLPRSVPAMVPFSTVALSTRGRPSSAALLLFPPGAARCPSGCASAGVRRRPRCRPPSERRGSFPAWRSRPLKPADRRCQSWAFSPS